MHESIEAVTKAANLLRLLALKESPAIPGRIGKYSLNATGGKKPRIEIGNHPNVQALEMGEVDGLPVVTVLVTHLTLPRESFGHSLTSFASLADGAPRVAPKDLEPTHHRRSDNPDNDMDRVVAGEKSEATVDQIDLKTKVVGGSVIVEHRTGRGFKVRGQGPNIVITPKNEGEHLRLKPTDPEALTEILGLNERASRSRRYVALA